MSLSFLSISRKERSGYFNGNLIFDLIRTGAYFLKIRV
jgi:hypothetical protein